ncbi:hypothetical protein JQC72_03595 [Polycladomyces sp. WAk]|uniref:Uncharacterized protein n=1 Tax=Polycladomyces zharkentensis TaxID=2807616 RepID=A0ABS2WGC7_9BACL|nr:hypothetical protein [Polycladomyces sp. WAk]MBN2908602.1 hypothetical protein [Polycladomyces sp. WAk]
MARKILSVVLKVVLVAGILILIFLLLWSLVLWIHSNTGDKVWSELSDHQNNIPPNSLPVGTVVFQSHFSWFPIICGISIVLAVILAIWGIKRAFR